MKTKNCENCKFYKAYHRVGIFSFWEERIGICELYDKEVRESETCEMHETEVPPVVTLCTLDKASEDIHYLLKIYRNE